MNAPILRGTCSRFRCWNRATTKDRDGRLVCHPDCPGGSGLDALPTVRLEDLPPIQWMPPPPRRLSPDITCPDCGKARPEGTKKRLCAKCERKRWRSA